MHRPRLRLPVDGARSASESTDGDVVRFRFGGASTSK
jgi:hypothetical protein